MAWRNTVDSYGSIAKILHWTIVILIIAQFFIAESADELPAGLEKLAVLSWHKSFGMLVLILALLRIAWRLANRGAPEPVSMPGWQRRAASVSHGLLYLLVLAQPISGWAMSSAANYPVTLFGWIQFPALVGADKALHEVLEQVHKSTFWVLAAVAGLHAVAAVYHHLWMKDDTLRRMLPFGGRRNS